MILHYPPESLILTTFSNSVRRNWLTSAPMQDVYNRGNWMGWTNWGVEPKWELSILLFTLPAKLKTALVNKIY